LWSKKTVRETQTLHLTSNSNDLAFVNAQLKTVTEPGDFEVIIGKQKVLFNYQYYNVEGRTMKFGRCPAVRFI